MNIDNITIGGMCFQRKLSASELTEYAKAVNNGLKVLDKEFGIIIHNSSFPSAKENEFGIGSLFSRYSQSVFLPFLHSHGITSVQQEPNYLKDVCPYSPLSSSKNIYMIPLEKLTGEEYGNLPIAKLLKKICLRNAKNGNAEKVNYNQVKKDYNTVLTAAYKEFKLLDNNTPPKIKFAEFKKDKMADFEPNAVFEILSKKYKTHDWRKWNETDRDIYSNPKNAEHLEDLKNKHANEIDFHMFKQWIIYNENESSKNNTGKLNIKIIADAPVGFPEAEIWLNKELFADDIALGSPPDDFAKNGQRWGFPVIKPEEIFNRDGSLGRGGNIIRKRYEEVFKECDGGVRIDHVIGLIDPYVYKISEPIMNIATAGRLYSSPHVDFLKKYSKHSDEEYASVIEKIILPAAKKYGIPQENVICEDLGALTKPVKNVMKRLNLTGIGVTQFNYRSSKVRQNNVIMPGSHDNPSYIEYTDNLFKSSKKNIKSGLHFIKKIRNLIADTKPYNNNLFKRIKQFINLTQNKSDFIQLSFAELFTSPAKKVQIFFTDFFGIGKTYNYIDGSGESWTLRLTPDFEDNYYKNLQRGAALNLPEALSTAIKHKGRSFAGTHSELVKKLDEFADILKS